MNPFPDVNLTLAECIDPRYPADQSIVLRYLNGFRYGATSVEDAAFKRCLRETSIREGVRIFPLLTHRGVEVHILDETSLMFTRTLKSIDGCVTTARCKLGGQTSIVFESGGNTGTALTAYGRRLGLETYFFIPEENLCLLNSRFFSSDRAHLIAVKDRDLVKEAAHLFGCLRGFALVPETAWRYEASMFRGMFILEHVKTHGRFDWLIQTISAAFGPVGIYRVLQRFGEGPRFLGVQQQANCPMYRAYKSTGPQGVSDDQPQEEELLAKVMYDIKPLTHGTYDELVRVLDSTNGDLERINRAEFADLMRREFDGKGILELLGDNGVTINLTGGEVREKAGLIALAGTVKAIDDGTIRAGSRVLCSLTGGATEADGKARPERRIECLDQVAEMYTHDR